MRSRTFIGTSISEMVKHPSPMLAAALLRLSLFSAKRLLHGELWEIRHKEVMKAATLVRS